MGQKPIRLKQLGITLDDIIVHLKDKDIIKTKIIEKQVIKEIDEEAVKRLVAEQVALQPSPQLDEEGINDLISKQVSNISILTARDVNQLINNILSAISIPSMEDIKQTINDEITSKELTKPEVDKQAVTAMIANQIASIPPMTPVNHIVEKVDIQAVKFYVEEELSKHNITPAPTSSAPEIDKEAIINLIISEVQKHLPEEPIIEVETLPTTIDDYKVWAKQEIDNASATARAKYVTVAHGQEALYAEKVDEATDYIAEGATNLDDFPLLLAEVNGTGKLADKVVDDILTKRSQWISVNAKIEEIRLRAKTMISASELTTIGKVEIIKTETISLLLQV